jgi:hypothetical protein
VRTQAHGGPSLPSLVDTRIDAARCSCSGGAFVWEFEKQRDVFVEIRGRGTAAGKEFSASARVPVHEIEGTDPRRLISEIKALETRLRRTADRYHRATPWPIMTRSEKDHMSYTEQVDRALAEYVGMSLQGLSLGSDEWSGFLVETGFLPDEFKQVNYKGIPISEGMAGIKYIVGD